MMLHYFFIPNFLISILVPNLLFIECQLQDVVKFESSNESVILLRNQFLPPLRKGLPYHIWLHPHTFPFPNFTRSVNEYTLCIQPIPPLPFWLQFNPDTRVLHSDFVPFNVSSTSLQVGFVSFFLRSNTSACLWPIPDPFQLVSAFLQTTQLPILSTPAPQLKHSILELLQSIPHSRWIQPSSHFYLPFSTLPLEIQLPSDMYMKMNTSISGPLSNNLTYYLVDQETFQLPFWMNWNIQQRRWTISPVTEPRTLNLTLIISDVAGYPGGVHYPFTISWGLLSSISPMPFVIQTPRPGVFFRINVTEWLNLSMPLFDVRLLPNSSTLRSSLFSFLSFQRDSLRGLALNDTLFQLKLTDKLNPNSSLTLPMELRVPPLLPECSFCENQTLIVGQTSFQWTLPFPISNTSSVWYSVQPKVDWLQFNGVNTFAGIPTSSGPSQFHIMAAQGTSVKAKFIQVIDPNRIPIGSSKSLLLPILLSCLGGLILFALIACCLYFKPCFKCRWSFFRNHKNAASSSATTSSSVFSSSSSSCPTSKLKDVEVTSVVHNVLLAYRGIPFQTLFRMTPGQTFAVCIRKSTLHSSFTDTLVSSPSLTPFNFHDQGGLNTLPTLVSPFPIERCRSFPNSAVTHSFVDPLPSFPFSSSTSTSTSTSSSSTSSRGHSYIHVPRRVWLHMEYDVHRGLGFIKGMPKASDVGAWEVRLYHKEHGDQILWNVIIRVI